jgi:tetratricopeptide (TPR) repeat protein
MRLGYAIWLSSALLATSGCTPSTADLRARAQAAISRHDYRAARVDLMTILVSQPGDRATLLTLARTDLELKLGQEAEATLLKARGAGASEAQVGILMAEALLQQGKAAQALAALKPLQPGAETYRLLASAYAQLDDRVHAEEAIVAGLKAYPDDAPILVEAARIHLASGKVDQAVAEANQAIARDARSTDAHEMRARISVEQNRAADALNSATKAVALRPDNIEALLIQAVALGNLGRLDQMSATLDKIDGLQGVKPATRLLRARLLAQQSRWQDASDQLAAAGDAVRKDPRTLALSGEVAAQLHKPEAAIAALSAYLATRPGDAKAAELLAEQKLLVGDASGARAAVDPFLAKPDASPGLLAVAARAAARDNQPELAAKLAGRARVPSPQYLGQLIVAANGAMEAERWGDAITLYQQLRKTTHADNVFVLNNLGWALFQARRGKEALPVLGRAYRLNPGNASVADSYGWVLWNSGGDRAQAVKLLREAAALAPGNRSIQAHLKQAAVS